MEDVGRTSGKLPGVIDGVLKANTFARQAEVKAWEQEYTACEHTLCLEQETSRKIDSQGMSKNTMFSPSADTPFRSGALLYV